MAEIDPQLKTDVAIEAYRNSVVLFGNGTLHSGAWSPYYIEERAIPSISVDPNRTDMSRADQLKFRRDVVNVFGMLLDGLDYDHIQSIPEAVDHLVGAIGFAHDDSVLKRRIKAKGYGKNEAILGNYLPGDITVLVDDVISTSGAKVDEKNLVEDISRPRDAEGNIIGEGLKVKDAVILLDRETGGIEKAREAGLEVHAALTSTELLAIPRAEGIMVDEAFMIIEGYKNKTITRPEDISPTWKNIEGFVTPYRIWGK